MNKHPSRQWNARYIIADEVLIILSSIRRRLSEQQCGKCLT